MGRHQKDYAGDVCDKFAGFRLPAPLLTSLDDAAKEMDAGRSDCLREILLRHFGQAEPAPIHLSQALPQLNVLFQSTEQLHKEHRSVGILFNQGLKRFIATNKLDVVPGLTRAYDRYLVAAPLLQEAVDHLLRL